MKIVIDLQACQSDSRFRGIGRYSSALTKAIVRQAGNHEIWIALNDRLPDMIPLIRADFDGVLPRERIVTFSVPGAVSEANPQNAWRSQTAELLREYFLAGLSPDLVHISSLFEGWGQDYVSSIGTLGQSFSTSVTLYDLIPFMNQEVYLPDQSIRNHYYRKIASLKKANLSLAISEYSRQEAITALGINNETILNISSAIDANFKIRQYSEDEQHLILDRLKITSPFILCAPGGFDQRKNLKNLIIAYSKLPEIIRSKYKLVIAGKIVHTQSFEDLLDRAKKAGLRNNELIFTDYLTDDDLIALYNLCYMFVFPSLYEGFGLPVLEAMACGAAVIGSNCTSIPEIIDRKDALFDPNNVEEITGLIQKVLTDDGFRNSLKELGHIQAKKFSWDNSAKKAIEAFEVTYERNSRVKNYHTIDNELDYKNLISKIGNIKVNNLPTTLDLVLAANRISINAPSPSQHQLLVDISVIITDDHKSGVHRVVRNTLLELMQFHPQGYNVRPIYFDGQYYRIANNYMADTLRNNSVEIIDDIVSLVRGDIYLGLDISSHISESIKDYLKWLNVLGVEIYFVVYDLLFSQHPEWFDKAAVINLDKWLSTITNYSTGLICISRSVAIELLNWLDRNPPDRFEVLPVGYFYLGSTIKNSLLPQDIPPDASIIQKVMEKGPSFMTVGLIDPRKGYAQLISAFESLWNRGFDVNLMMVGRIHRDLDGTVDRILNHPMLGKHLFWLHHISDAYLEKLYMQASACILPSEGEGFGLPLIEAAHFGTPLILRDIPVFRELAGDNASYFSGLAPEDLASEIISWLERNRYGQIPSSLKIKGITWAESTSQLVDTIINKKWISKWSPIKH